MAEIQEFGIEVSKKMRYYTLGNIEKADTLLIALHGFGQLSKYFIKKFEFLPDNYLILAPEGMHRFYLQGNSGRVGASWMTKEARELDIAENTNALQSLLKTIKAEKQFSKIILLGFSQGGATAARWYFSVAEQFDHLILWASVFPPDLEKPKLEMNTKNYFVLGNQDEYYSEAQQFSEIEAYKEIGFNTIHFDGKHDIHQVVLSVLFGKLK
ncbi:MAG: alpha/beta hydrolase [Flavobacteriales bacterium]|nr:alpha/beta hydrolase [Flavobacteriales bacterium]